MPGAFDGALFSLTHDVLQSEDAVANVWTALKPNARVGAFGVKAAGGWRAPFNFVTRRIARRYITTFSGFERPWRLLEPRLDPLVIEEVLLGCAYLLHGRAKLP